MLHGRYLLHFLLSCFALCDIAGCGDEPCEEPDPRGEGVVDDACVTTRDCVADLACYGTDYTDGAHCVEASALPGAADPGCLAHPDEWVGHRAHGVLPSDVDEEGCELLVFVQGCNCAESAEIGECVPISPFRWQETWRRCDGCCWRLVSLWYDEAICEVD